MDTKYVIFLLGFMTLINSSLILIVISRLNSVLDVFEERPELPIKVVAPYFVTYTVNGEKMSFDHFLKDRKPTVFVFLSPTCGICEQTIPLLRNLEPLAHAFDGTKFVYVVEAKQSMAKSYSHRHALGENVLSAPRDSDEFARDYNPHGYYPYYCHIDINGIVQSRGSIGTKEWKALDILWRKN